MPSLINQTNSLENTWQTISDYNEALPEGNILVAAQYWLDNQVALCERGNVSIIISGDTDLDALGAHLNKFEVIAVSFPAFADGRGYSQARLLKERYNYQGEIRAIGDVLLDQLHFMKRCGFDTFDLKDGLEAEKALQFFDTFSDPYQLAYDVKTPLFRRKA
ncbi:MAG: oxidoreductase [Bermanella sp.]|nr:oxidoreductase [Bermanella sp.]